MEHELIEHGFTGSQARLQIVSSFLQSQGIDEVCELAGRALSCHLCMHSGIHAPGGSEIASLQGAENSLNTS